VTERTIFRTRRRLPWRLFTFVLAAALALVTASALIGSTTRHRASPPAARVPHRRPPSRKHHGKAPVRPPQFLVVSFDGSGGTQLWPYWRDVARRAHAHFTFFVSGRTTRPASRRSASCSPSAA